MIRKNWVGKVEGVWVLVRPTYGFNQPNIEEFPTWRSAYDSALAVVKAGGVHLERRGEYDLDPVSMYGAPMRPVVT